MVLSSVESVRLCATVREFRNSLKSLSVKSGERMVAIVCDGNRQSSSAGMSSCDSGVVACIKVGWLSAVCRETLSLITLIVAMASNQKICK